MAFTFWYVIVCDTVWLWSVGIFKSAVTEKWSELTSDGDEARTSHPSQKITRSRKRPGIWVGILILIQIQILKNIGELSNVRCRGFDVKVEIPCHYQIMREWGIVGQYILQLTKESRSRTRWTIHTATVEPRPTNHPISPNCSLSKGHRVCLLVFPNVSAFWNETIYKSRKAIPRKTHLFIISSTHGYITSLKTGLIQDQFSRGNPYLITRQKSPLPPKKRGEGKPRKGTHKTSLNETENRLH